VVVSVVSQAVLGVGIALALAAIVTIYVTSLSAQNTQQQPIPSSNQQGGGVNSNTGSNKNITDSTLTSQITIPQGAAAQQVDVYYNPSPATVSAGSKVTWTNRDNAPHTATDLNGSFDTGIINVASSGSSAIKIPGKLSYHCTIHPWMTGMLQVVPQVRS
jgi:plastocyanin